MLFADLGLSDELLKAVAEAGYTEATPIQAQAIPPVLMMRDIIGIAQTGTGKTASFVLPMIDILAQGRSRARMPRSLILEPTRELAAQVAENFEKYGKYHKLSMALLIGGVSMGDQLAALEKGVDVLIATPGRLMDLFGRGKIMLNGCSLLVIDEADRMLDMGFIPDIEEICTKLPPQRQTLLFSATMPPVIKKLADKFLSNPKSIEVARPATASANIAQFLVSVDERAKRDALRSLLVSEKVDSAIIFCNRKTMVRELNQSLKRHGFKSGEIHGDIDQASRVAELDRFKSGEINLLVASDVAARGLDIKGVSHVFNYDAPWHPDDYVHRIGRTGRAGATGRAFTFVTRSDAEAIANIEKLIGNKIERVTVGGVTTSARSEGDDRDGAPKDAAPKAASGERSSGRGGRGRRNERPSAESRAEDSAPAQAEAETEERIQSKPEGRAGRPARRAKPESAAERAPEPEARPEAQPEARPEPAARAAEPRRDRPAEPRREREERAPQPARQQPRQHARGNDDDGGPDEGWNGPTPSFLNFGFDTSE